MTTLETKSAELKRAVIFDCDGVLVDSEPIGLKLLGEALQHFGFDPSEYDLERFCGRTDAESILELCEETGREIDLNAYLEHKLEVYLQGVETCGLEPFEGVPELIRELARSGFAIGVASSGPPRKIAANLRASGLNGELQVIVSAEEVERGKPAPDVFLEAARRLGVQPEMCSVVEDAPAGLHAAKAAGMRAVAVAHTFTVEELEPLADLAVEHIRRLTLEDLS